MKVTTKNTHDPPHDGKTSAAVSPVCKVLDLFGNEQIAGVVCLITPKNHIHAIKLFSVSS